MIWDFKMQVSVRLKRTTFQQCNDEIDGRNYSREMKKEDKKKERMLRKILISNKVVKVHLQEYPGCNLNSDLDSDSKKIYLLSILCQWLARHVHMCSS